MKADKIQNPVNKQLPRFANNTQEAGNIPICLHLKHSTIFIDSYNFIITGCDCLHVTSDGLIVLCSDDDDSSSSDCESSSRIILYDTEGNVQQEVVIDEDVPYDLTDVFLTGQQCLALLNR